MNEILWNTYARKEVLELIEYLWPQLDQNGRLRLSREIISGPPKKRVRDVDEHRKNIYRDRSIFDRIAVIYRIDQGNLNDILKSEWTRVTEKYPDWLIPESEDSKFSVWTEITLGHDTDYTSQDLMSSNDGQLLEILVTTESKREGLLDSWRIVAQEDPLRAVRCLREVVSHSGPIQPEIWSEAFRGLRDGKSKGAYFEQLAHLIGQVPSEIIADEQVIASLADLLQAASKDPSFGDMQVAFWEVCDVVLPFVVAADANSDEPKEDWVSLAINRPLGRFTEACLNAMFVRRLKVSDQIPRDVKPRLEKLVNPGIRSHRLARVIAASRSSYLFAVDPDWMTKFLIPSFNWKEEDEACAVWQGFSWHARIDRQLWAALKPFFLDCFTETRIENLGAFRRNLAQLLMLVGAEFGVAELPRGEVRRAVRAMPDSMRRSTIAWTLDYLEHRARESTDESSGADGVWVDRISPLLNHVWPPDKTMRSEETSEQWAELALVMDKKFHDVIEFIRPRVVETDGWEFVSRLYVTEHPQKHPEETIEIIGLVVKEDSSSYNVEKMKDILERVKSARPEIAISDAFIRWENRVRLLER